MNSALKPVLASAGVPQPAGQSSPAKGNVASVNHASVGHPQGAQNSLNHATNSNNLAVQNLTQHVPAPQVPPHAVPSMAPVSANMAQMAQNMSNHGNLSHVNQSSCPPAPAVVASPSKAPSTSSPLSLVAEKPQPLALTRSPEKPEKKEPDSTGQSNGTVDSPKSASNTPVTLKAQNTEANKDKIDIAKTSPSTTKPPEKPSALPSTPQKPESANPATQADVPTQSKAATASEPSEKSPAKPVEPKPAPTADIAPTQSDSKPVPESASNSEPSPPEKETAPAPAKVDPPVENAKTEPVKAEEKEEEASEKPPSTEEKPKEAEVKEKPEPKKEDTVDAPVKVVEKEKVELKKVEPKKEPKPKSTLKLATVTPPLRKRRQVSPAKGDGVSPAKKAVEGENTPDARTKRNRTKVQLYQSPTPELAMATKLSASAGRSTPTKPNDDKLIVFYKNEYLAVRNAEGGFYVCQAMQNVYRTTRKIKIRWLSQDKTADPSGETYKPDFYDVTDMECVLTTLSLSRAAGGGGSQLLKAAEQARATSILQRALKAESSPGSLQLTPEHPDGLDLSLYTDESQLEQRARKRAASKAEPGKGHAAGAAEAKKEAASPAKKARTTPKRSPKSARKAKPAPPKPNNNKRKPAGSAPVVASTSKTATAVIEKAKAAAKATPKRTPPVRQAKPEPVVTPLRKGRRAAAKEAPTPIAQPSTSTGKSTRTPRKPPTRK